ncbi:MAG: CvpA family protein [Bacteroidales bacterium]|nr:CvpA family protein [Bacteroidales bacterium]
MEIFDIVILVLLAAAFVRGYMNGIISELAGIAALVLGVFGAAKLSPYVETMLSSSMSSGPVRLIAFAIALSIIVIAVHFVSSVVSKLVKAMKLSTVNKILGGIFGAAKVLFIASCILGIANRLWPGEEGIFTEEQKNSYFTYPAVEGFSAFVFPYLDKGLDAVKDNVNKMNEDHNADNASK